MERRRTLMESIGITEVDELNDWTVLEDIVLENASKWNKTYDDNYNEYMCYIEIPKVESEIATTSTMILGSAEAYYVIVGSTAYSYGIFAKTSRINQEFVMCESGRGALSGITASLKIGMRKLSTFSSQISTGFELPAGTQIIVLAR